MSTTRKKNRNYSLVFATLVAFASVCSAGVSTFAWFQANVQASVRASSDGTTILVSAPDGFTLASPEVFAYKGNGANGYTGPVIDLDENETITIESDFESILNGEYGDETLEQEAARLNKFNISSLWPGYKMTFALKIDRSSGGGSFSSGSLILNDYYPGLDTNRKILNSNADGLVSDHYIAMAQAIKLSGSVTNSSTYASESAMVIRDNNNGDGITLNAGYFYREGEKTTNEKVESESYTFVSGDVDGSPTTIYFFYTVEFSDEDVSYDGNPIKYTEYKKQVVDETTTYSPEYDTPSSWANTRYFKPDSSGNSSCYEGLSRNGGETNKEFRISQITVKVM